MNTEVRIRALFIDDQQQCALMIKPLLDTYFADIDVVQESNYNAAISLLAKTSIDLVISSYLSQHDTQLLLLRYLRADPRYHYTPVIFVADPSMTLGHDLYADLDINMSGVSYLNYPIQLEDFIAKISNMIFFVHRQKSLENQLISLTHAHQKIEQHSLNSDCIHNLMQVFQSPLSVIISLSQLIQLDQNITPHNIEIIAKLQDSAQHLFELSNQFIDLALIKSEQLSLSANTRQLHSLFSALIQEMKVVSDKKGVSLNYHLSKNVPSWVVIDGHKLEQIVKHLLSHALSLTEKGTISLSVNADHHWLYLEITDTGIGISDEQLVSIFQNHCQFTRSKSEGLIASGVSLNLVKQLVELLGGKININSWLGVGTKVLISLPLVKVEGINEESQPTSIPLQAPFLLLQEENKPKSFVIPETPLSSKKVLLVEDNKANQLVALRMLQKLGVQPSLALNGEEAMQLRQQKHFDLVLLDIHMPIKDGYQTVQEIRAEEKDTQQHQIVIAVSVNNTQSDFLIASQMGMDDYLTKPIDFKLLEEKLNHWLIETAIDSEKS